LSAQRIVDEISRDAAQPSPQLGRLSQFAQLLPSREKGFLRQILTLTQAARGTVSQRADEGLIAGNDLSKRIVIASQARVNKFHILADRRWGHYRCHHIAATVVEKQEYVTNWLRLFFSRPLNQGKGVCPSQAGVRQKSSVLKGKANGTGSANSLNSQRDADPRVPGGSAPPPIPAPAAHPFVEPGNFAVSVRVHNFQRSYLLLPTPTLPGQGEKWSG
jgi:hypothetical protein